MEVTRRQFVMHAALLLVPAQAGVAATVLDQPPALPRDDDIILDDVSSIPIEFE
jgi:hypothetical protein